VNESVARFRGALVQLVDRDTNILRTRHLDYYTKDSLAVFDNGGAMKEKTGQIIESEKGQYDSKKKLFTFSKDVNMFTDSIFVSTSKMDYLSDSSKAVFGYGTDVWKEDKMLSSNSGWYDRKTERFCFNRDVHLMSKVQEGWCDTLYFNRNTRNVTLLGNAQVTDTTRGVSAVAGLMSYLDSLKRITLLKRPAVIIETNEQDKGKDTVYVGADTLLYFTRFRYEVDSSVVAKSLTRVKEMHSDPVESYRARAFLEAKKAAEAAAKDDPNNAAAAAKKRAQLAKAKETATADNETPAAEKDLAQKDTLAKSGFQQTDTLQNNKIDSTRVGFATALKNVRIFRKDIQVFCDSLVYNDIDSIACLYKNPHIWNEIKQQYSADSIFMVVKGKKMERLNMVSDAFIHIMEDSVLFDQIRGAEMAAYFDANNKLSRFDALGGANAIFFMEENGVLATVNKKESKMLSARFVEGKLDKVYYFDLVKSDAYPVVQMKEEDRRLKGFHWEPELRPSAPGQITARTLRPTERKHFESIPKATFAQTDKYFPGYITGIYSQMAQRDSIKADNARNARHRRDSLAYERRLDSLARADSLQAVKAKLDTVKTQADTLAAKALENKAAEPEKQLTEKELRKAEAEKKRNEKQAAYDRKLAQKQAARDAKAAAKLRKNKLKSLIEDDKRKKKESAIIERYRRRFEKEYEKNPSKYEEKYFSTPDSEEAEKVENDL